MMLFVLLLMVGAAAAQSSAERRHTLCGRELAKAHSLYCYGLDPQPTEAVEYNLSWSSEGEDTFIPEVKKMPERFAYRARRFAADKLRERSLGLMETCCLRPCHVVELLSHC